MGAGELFTKRAGWGGWIGLAGLLMSIAGCFGPKAMPTPVWNPDVAADNCMKQYDTDSDGSLNKKELAASPGLNAAVSYLDADGDKKLSREEIRARIQLYQETKVNKQQLCRVTIGETPVMDAEVEFVPEDFLKEFIVPARGSVPPGSQDGIVIMSSEGLPDAVQVGLYKVKITSPSMKIPPQYNEETTLGYEVSPVTIQGRDGVPEFKIKRK
ncbi:MAG: hypothetical protein U0795_03475 [Pirellulales bacterium]